MASIDMSLEDIIKKDGVSGRGRGRGRGRGAAAAGGSGRGKGKGKGAGGGIKKTGGAIKKADRVGGGGGGRGGRGGGRGRGGGATLSAASKKQAKEEVKACLVSATTDIKASAGYVCAMLRAGTPPPVMAISPTCVNQATKLLALAHSYLEEEHLDLYAQVDFPEYAESSQTAMVKLHVFKKAKRTNLAQVKEQIFTNATSEPGKVAGYIANCMREAGKNARVCITAAGPQPMLRALKGVFLARHYLQARPRSQRPGLLRAAAPR
jgi:stage V sporulation protein SpoVS